tara:strand:- start:11208 stop:11501 length:294 start_codon:yes stop_codon:yes gene_type:complete
MTGTASFGELFNKTTSVRKLKVKLSDGKEWSVEKEGLSFKKIFKSEQGNAPEGTRFIRVEYTNRKGNAIDRWQKVPIGRFKKVGNWFAPKKTTTRRY